MCISLDIILKFIFCHFFSQNELSHLSDTMYLVYATPPTVYYDSLETLQVFRSWSADVQYCLDIILQSFCQLFYKMNLVIFLVEVNRC